MNINQLDELMQYFKLKGKEFTTYKQLQEDFPEYDMIAIITALSKDGYLNEGQENYYDEDNITKVRTPKKYGRVSDGIYKISYHGLRAMKSLFWRWLMNTPYRKAQTIYRIQLAYKIAATIAIICNAIIIIYLMCQSNQKG
jgi:hypothetical protein